MEKKSGWRPEHTLMAAVLVLIGSLFVAAVIVVAGVMQERRVEDLAPYGLGVVAIGVVAALLINAWGKRVWHKQRPEWLETQAWKRDFEAKIRKEDKPPG